MPLTKKDDLLTVAALGVLAFIATDLAHEVFGHAAGLLIAGGRAGIFTTTKLISEVQLPSPSWRIFDLGGPAGNLLWATFCLAWQRKISGAKPRLRLFLWASAMFSLFWEFGYLMKCGVTGAGDGMALIEGLRPEWLWRAGLFLAGLLLYRAAIRLAATDLHFVMRSNESEGRTRVRRLLATIYFAGGLAACAGSIFDPRGRMEIWNSGAMTSYVACLGLVLVPAIFARSSEKLTKGSATIERSNFVVILAAGILLLFVLLLGPGIHVSL